MKAQFPEELIFQRQHVGTETFLAHALYLYKTNDLNESYTSLQLFSYNDTCKDTKILGVRNILSVLFKFHYI